MNQEFFEMVKELDFLRKKGEKKEKDYCIKISI